MRQTLVHSKWLTTDAFAILLPKAVTHYLNTETWTQTYQSISPSYLHFKLVRSFKIFMLFDSVIPLAGIYSKETILNNSKK